MPDVSHAPLTIPLDRASALSLAGQIHAAIRDAVREGRLVPGARLPSWRDLAAQLGVARGTVRAAYERLTDEQFIVGQGAAGTRVAAQSAVMAAIPRRLESSPLPELFSSWSETPLPFQIGVPAQDAFPFKLWSRLTARAAREEAATPVSYPDPRGYPDLRHEIASYLALARGIRCTAAQVIVTAGFAGALGLVIQTLRLQGQAAWMEDPGSPLTRLSLNAAGLKAVPVPVDSEGIDVDAGMRLAPNAPLAVVTPGQQAPLGMPLSLARRVALLDWAAETGAWILEDDYLSELQLRGRASPALASLDRHGRVLHVGTFSKTISPSLRLGFLVVPPDHVERFAEVAACVAPAPAASLQRAVAAFMAEGHYLRHLRRMKRLYASRRAGLVAALREAPHDNFQSVDAGGGLLVRMILDKSADDIGIAKRALAFGLAPVPLSVWYADPSEHRGLFLGVTNCVETRVQADCVKLIQLLH